jgi:hypothetical protein
MYIGKTKKVPEKYTSPAIMGIDISILSRNVSLFFISIYAMAKTKRAKYAKLNKVDNSMNI